MHGDGERGAERDRRGEPQQHLVGGHPQVARRAGRGPSTAPRATCVGAGRMSSSTPPARTTASHAPSRRRAMQRRQRAAVTPPPARRARARAARPPRRRRAWRGRGRSTSSVSTTRAGPRRQQHDAVGQQHRLLDVVRDEQHGARLARERVGQPGLHLQPRQRVERAERLVEAEHGPARQQRAQERDALAHPARQRRGPRALEALEPERGEVLVRRRPRRPRDAPATRSASPALSSALSHGSSPSRCGISAAGAGAHRPRVGRDAARRRARAGSTCRSRSGRRRPRPRARRRAATRRRAPARAPNAFSTPATSTPPAVPSASRGSSTGSLGLVLHRSLRGHYPTGSKGQRRVRGRYLSRLPPAPLNWVSPAANRSGRAETRAAGAGVRPSWLVRPGCSAHANASAHEAPTRHVSCLTRTTQFRNVAVDRPGQQRLIRARPPHDDIAIRGRARRTTERPEPQHDLPIAPATWRERARRRSPARACARRDRRARADARRPRVRRLDRLLAVGSGLSAEGRLGDQLLRGQDRQRRRHRLPRPARAQPQPHVLGQSRHQRLLDCRRAHHAAEQLRDVARPGVLLDADRLQRRQARHAVRHTRVLPGRHDERQVHPADAVRPQDARR